MSKEEGAAEVPGLRDAAGRSLAERIEWLTEHMWPKDAPPPKTNQDAADAIAAETGVDLSSTGFWKLRTGRGGNPTLKTLGALQRFFGVPFNFFSDDPEEAEAVGDEIAVLVLLRQAGITRTALRALVGLSAESQQMINEIIESAARMEERRSRIQEQPESAAGS